METASGLRFPPELAPDTPTVPTVSYVEWTRPRSVEQTGDDTFLASVLIRRLVAVDGIAFERLPTEWVEIELRLESGGRARAISLPRITTPPRDGLVPIRDDNIEWFTDEAGISWPSSAP